MVNAAQRQRKLAAKAARRKAVVAEKKKIEMTASSLAGRIKLAAKGPIVLCTMPPGLFDTGMGLPAAKDTPAVEVIFGTVDAGACTETFTFGRDGKPFYIPGPTDAPARMRAGAQALEKSRGTGNWDFMIGVEPELQCQPPLSLTAATRHGPACPGQLVRHVPEGGGADTPGQKGYTTANARSRWHMAPTANTDWT